MGHLGERITDFIFEELPAADLAEAKTHVAQCGECRAAVEHFQRTRSLLQAVPDLNPPRSATLTFEKPRATRGWTWKWLAPIGAAAAILVVVFVTPMQVQWNDSQLTIAFGPPPAAAAEVENAARIQELQSQLAFLANLQQGQQRELYEALSSVNVLVRRSSSVGD